VVVDNSDNFMSSALESELTDLVNSLNQPAVEPRILQQTALEIVELYPYIEYMKYLLPGSLALAMFVSVMIGGGMLYIDDKAEACMKATWSLPSPSSNWCWDSTWPEPSKR